MGAGKSAVGRALSGALGSAFVDCDGLVTAVAGPIERLFAERGEAGFRAVERDVTVAAIKRARTEPCVLALGGGAVLSGDVREALRRLPHVAWLTAPADVLWARVVSAGLGTRPLARDEAAFRRLLEERAAFYESVATMAVVNDGNRPPAAVAAEIVCRMGAPDDVVGVSSSQGEGTR